MKLGNFRKILSEFYNDLKSIADESVGGFAIDSPTPDIDEVRRRKKAIIRQLAENKDRRVMIDFDKTINSYKSGWNDGKMEDPPFKGAKEAIDKLKNAGYEIAIFSTRASQSNADNQQYNVEDAIQSIKNYLVNHDIYFYIIFIMLWGFFSK